MTYTVEAPTTPGSAPIVQGQYESVREARAAAAQFARRRDLTYQDVVIRRGTRRVEFAGPVR